MLPYPTAEDSNLLGIGIGALAAAAISSSEDVTGLIPAAVHAVVVALHMGLRADQEAKSIQGRITSQSWAMTVVGVSMEKATQILERFNFENNLPLSYHAYVSSISETALTISGPPEVLIRVRAHDDFAGLEKAVVPICSPRNASHLFDGEDVSIILEKAATMTPTRSTASIPVLSCGTGKFLWANGYRSVIHNAVYDVLCRPMLVDKCTEHLESTFQANLPVEVLVVPVGTEASRALQSRLSTALQGSVQISVQPQSPSNPSSTSFSPKGKCKIAVVGMAGRFPGASSANELWSLLQRKVDMCREVPALRWDVNTHVDAEGKKKNTSKVRWGCWLDEPDKFDATFFGISPREAPQVDPAQRLALLTAYEAMEHAGIVPGRTPSTREDRVGVFYGVTSNDWCESNSGQDIDLYYIPGANRAFIPGRINYFFKFSGPSYAVDTACSSSLSAIHIACNSLWQGDIDMAVAGGTNVLTNPDMTTGLDKGHFLSETGNCKTFDASADGYCRGEGVATVLLKRLDDAIEDGDTIHGVLDSAYTNHSAEAESITRPHVGAQKDVLERVLNNSGTHPNEVSYIEMHGTGTQAGDTREITSVCEVFAPINETRRRPRSKPLHIGGLKANIGHGESASGVSALIKVLQMMKHNQIPPHCGIKTRLNPAFPRDLAERNVHIDLETAAWPREDGVPRKVIINNFSAAGGNSSILVEDAPLQPQALDKGADSLRPIYPVAISARTSSSLKGNVKAMLDHLANHTGTVSLPEISYTTTARRMHHHFRFITSVSDLQALREKLEAVLEAGDQDNSTNKRVVPPKAVLFSFTGQGSQYPGMGKQLMERLGVFRDDITKFDHLARKLGFPSILPLFQASNGDAIADYDPVVVQLANTCMQIALARIWISWGVKPSAVVGHSLGEYAALNVAGVLSDSDTVYLVGRRAQHLQNFCEPYSHAMLAVVASVSELENVSGTISRFEIACVNGPKETVLAGTAAQVSDWKKTLTAAGIHSTHLRVPYAFHSSQIQPILSAYVNNAKGVAFHEPQVPVLSPLEGRVVTESHVFGPAYVRRHAREPVQMMKCLEAAFSDGTLPAKGAFAIEFGPHPVVSGMIKATLGSAVTVLPTLRRKANPWEVLTTSLCSLYAAGSPVVWDGYFADLPSARRVVELPAYTWDMKPYWIPYRNNWTLTKGDIPFEGSSLAPPSAKPSIVAAPSGWEPLPMIESTSIHSVLEETVMSDGLKISVDCDVSREDINPFIRSHIVEGYSLCTPAVYADIGFSLGTYALDRYQPNHAERVVSIRNIEITRALIGSAEWKQTLQCTAQFDWASKGGKLRFTVHDEAGTEVGQVSTCEVKFVDGSTRKQLQAELATFKGNFERMRQSETSSRFNGPMSYRLVSALAEFNPDYHCIDDVLYDSDAYEAACRVSFGQMKKGGRFHVNPAAVDGLTQSAGFVMNANNNTNLQADVFVNHGWADFQLFERIRDDCQYSTHVKMRQSDEQLWTGDIAIFEGERAVGFVQGVKIQGLPRKFLKFLLSQAVKPPRVKGRTVGAPAGGKPVVQSVTAVKSTPVAPTKASAASPVALPRPIPDSYGPPATTFPPSGDILAVKRALEIIAEESEIPLTDLKDDTHLSDVGIDSLISLMVASRFAEELGITIDASTFMEKPTVADIKQFVIETATGCAPGRFAEVTPDIEETPTVDLPTPEVLTEVARFMASVPSMDSLQSWAPIGQSTTDTPGVINFDDVLKIMAEEIEVSLDTITDQTSLHDLGVDSLLSLLIGSRLRDELDIEIDPSSLLDSLSSVGELRQALTSSSGEGCTPSSTSTDTGNPSSSNTAKLDSVVSTPTSGSDFESVPAPIPRTASVILQGTPRSATSSLWFFPDGSGLASSYIPLPRIRSDLVVYGINSPYLKKGVEMTCTWDELIGSYIQEIQRRQPQGPYSFAGWSAGGIGAYHAAQVLMNAGHSVRDLIIIDSPPPFHLAPLPERFFRYCSTAGLFGGRDGQAPEWVINHFRNINKVLSHYIPTPLKRSTLRKINILWACESSVDDRFERQPDDPEDMKFLTTKRTDFTPGRWGPLFGDVPVQVDRVENEHHWSILKGDSAVKVSQYIARALA
ncbi:polyketide synthetase [Grosmannia clavigera kw1407]|uniref:Polyketide synthetase n=1 Tax=Grosmannia clavigera (strain kw1407 / UAMH 11150) TaxID=655863 RepID=F0XMV4_GROCL|nr:polyketide synthetase [Grosmannia clavigera kw1407]EFX00827.1 polyketide synthetase [Grosmannia clavigera kw1407]